MKHSGKARQAALTLILWAFVALVAVFVAGAIGILLGHVLRVVYMFFLALWSLFALFTFYFFRDPDPRVPAAPGLVVSPAHGKVDIVDRITEPLFIGGECQRISIFLSVIDIHVQNAPVSGKIIFTRYTMGQFLNAMRSESASHNENLLLGIEASERAGLKIGVRLIAGLIARRIVPFVTDGAEILRGERVSLIQFGSRVDLYLPLAAKIKVKPGDRAVGGETIMATLD